VCEYCEGCVSDIYIYICVCVLTTYNVVICFCLQGTAPVRGCKITVDTKSDKKHGFVMTHDTRKPLYMAAESDKLMKGVIIIV
jgi:hypothetical protein